MATISRSSTYKRPAGTSARSYVKSKKEVPGENRPLPPSPLKGEGRGEGLLPSGGSEKILEEVATLSKDKQREILAKLSMLVNSGGGEEQRERNMWSGAVHNGLVKANGGSPMGVPGIMLIHKHVALSDAWASVAGFMQASKLNNLQVSERQSVYHLLADLVLKHAKKTADYVGTPLTPKFIAGQCVNITSIFEQSFPGYVASGLATIVARSFLSGVRHDQNQDDGH